MAKKYDITSKSDMKKLQKDMEKSVMDMARKQANHASGFLVCPKCNTKFSGRVGPNICPSCHSTITVTPMS